MSLASLSTRNSHRHLSSHYAWETLPSIDENTLFQLNASQESPLMASSGKDRKQKKSTPIKPGALPKRRTTNNPIKKVEEPSNRAIICDLGVGKVKSMMTMVTREGANAGTLAYQHIEQISEKPPFPSVDVYSFGVIMLEVFTRTPAWSDLSFADVVSE
ncbi:hypothetical protein ACROYT_G014034 [Oculina patagonica]